MKFDHLRATYFEECSELIESAYAQLTALADGNANDDTVHALFRAIHSVKGGGGAFGFNRVVGLAHVMETLLDQLRDGVLAFNPDLVALLLRGTDALADMLNAERNGTQIRDGFEDQLISLFNEAAGQAAPNEGEVIAQVKAEGHTGWRIEFRPHAALFRHANEPLLLVRELRRLGEVAVTADWTRLPTLNEISAEDSYLNWRFELLAEVTRDKIEEVFEFVMDDCELTIEPISDDSDEPTSEPGIDTITAATGLKPAGTSLLGVKAPLTTEEAPANITPAQSVRVDVSKVDRLVNLVGELVINQAMLVQLGSTLPPDLCPGLISGLETLSQHLRELQEGVMAIRTQPVRLVFARMPRLVRELSSTLNKDARLIITGEATEIDKTVVEQLADPLTHLLRNALDHGIEPPDEREAAGKPRQGTVHLSAEQRSGRIVIEVSDDGRGINRERVMARAKERNLIPADAQLTDAEINELIFLPSFSTAATVSAVSGRGVGMDVVRRNIQALGGRIAVESNQGSGSRFILSLPLTLAVLDGLVVSVGQEAYILPISTIVESLRPNKRDIHSVAGHGEVLSIRGAYVPLLQLHQRFGVRDAVTDPSRGIVVIVETDKAGHLGLVVDDLVGQQQVVVKSLETNYQPVEGIGGATILGDGRVALILDIAGLATASATYTPPSAGTASTPANAAMH